jgi:hypothetical protein
MIGNFLFCFWQCYIGHMMNTCIVSRAIRKASEQSKRPNMQYLSYLARSVLGFFEGQHYKLTYSQHVNQQYHSCQDATFSIIQGKQNFVAV